METQPQPMTGLESAIMRFLSRAQNVRTAILANPTEELVEATQSHRPVSLFQRKALYSRAPQARAVARLEENYLYSSRRFPALGNNTIGGGALGVASYVFFNRGIGDDGQAAGWPTGFAMSLNETNLEMAGQIPMGTSFVFNQIGVTFNADASTADVNTMVEACTLVFKKSGGQFTINHGPLKMWPGGMGTEGYASTTNVTSTVQSAHNGAADIRAVRNLRISRVLREKETFSYEFAIPRTTKATDGSAWALSAFVVATIWLWGGQKNVIPT